MALQKYGAKLNEKIAEMCERENTYNETSDGKLILPG